jgi:hypothetical protein
MIVTGLAGTGLLQVANRLQTRAPERILFSHFDSAIILWQSFDETDTSELALHSCCHSRLSRFAWLQ